MRINLLSHDNGVGLTQDVQIVKSILQPRFRVKFLDLRHAVPEPCDVNIFFEILDSRFYKLAKHNLFFPNPEWFMWPQLLKGIRLVLAKTRDAERIFQIMNCNTHFTSFTSDDRLMDTVPRERAYLHTAGQSLTKGTDTVFTNWQKRWPQLIFTKLKEIDKYRWHNDNILTCFERMPKDILWTIQNKCIFHVCPSEYEGFGHYIWEAKSCGGIVITTGGPPMNEMIQDGKDGFLVNVARTRKMNFGRLQLIDKDSFIEVIEKTIKLKEDEIMAMSQAARDSWEANDRFFRTELLKVVGGLR